MKILPSLILSTACFLTGIYATSAQTAPTETSYIFDPGTTGTNGTGTGSNGSGSWDNATSDFSNGTSDTIYPAGGMGVTSGTVVAGTSTLTLTAGTIGNVLPGEFLNSSSFAAGTYVMSISGDVVTLSSPVLTGKTVNNNSTIIFTPSTNETVATGTVSTEGNGVNAVFGGTGFTGTPGTVTVSGTQYADNMTVNSAGYTFSGGTITIGSRSGSAGDLILDASTTINSAFSDSNIYFGNGTLIPTNLTLTLGGSATTVGTIAAYNNNQTVADASTVIMTSGTYGTNNNELNIGNATAGTDGLVIDTGATFIHNYLFVGYGSTGLITINGGTLTDGTSNGPLVIGRSSTGRVILETGIISNTNTGNGGITIGMSNGSVGELDVQGGTMTSTLLGIGSGYAPATNAATYGGIVNISGGTSTVGTVGFGTGYGGVSTAGYGTLNLTGGTLYVGSGGIVNDATGLGSTFVATVNLSGGTVGATADWSSSVNMTLNPGTAGVGAGVASVTFEADDGAATPNAHNITLSGILSGTGGFTKTGAGTLTLSNALNTYTGKTMLSAGILSLASSESTNVEVGIGAAGATPTTFQLQLTSSVALGTSATLTLDSGTLSFVALDYAAPGTDIITALYIDGVQVAAGTYTADELNSMYNTTDFSSSDPTANFLTVTTGAAPEPQTWAMLFLGLGALVMLARRRASGLA